MAVVTATTAGARTQSINTENLSVCDTASDSQFVSGPWVSNYGSSGSVVFKGGFGYCSGNTRVVGGGEKLSKIQACRSNTLRPMSCGSWVSTNY